jgi:hypothetical protein
MKLVRFRSDESPILSPACEVYRQSNFITKEECKEWIKITPKSDSYTLNSFENRVHRLIKFGSVATDIVERVKKHFYDELGMVTELQDSAIQVWPKGGGSSFHKHDSKGREDGDYNSVLYLNDNFWGGEFKTLHEQIKPSPGLLTLFDGKNTYHGLNKSRFNHRYTIIFWWKNTKFIE